MSHAHGHCGCRAGRREFALPGADLHYAPDLELEPEKLRIEAEVDIPARKLTGHVTHTLRARRAGVQDLALDGVALLELRVEDPGGHALSWRYDGEKLRVHWEAPFDQDETRQLSIRYYVERPASGIIFSYPSVDRPDAPTFAASDHETERARHWLPCIDHPSARPRLEWLLTAAREYEILANGSLVETRELEHGRKQAHWVLDHPCPAYLSCFAIGDFTRWDDEAFEGRPVAAFSTREHDAAQLERTFGPTRKMLAWMSEKLGTAFPYPKYFQFAVPGVGGAMENISLVSWDDSFVLDETLASEWQRLIDQINVHEMAHSYFGDLIVCRDFAHSWLKESWATYMEQCWFEDQLSVDEARYEFTLNADAYFQEADEAYKRPIVTRRFNHSWTLFDRHLYPGGACRLHTLRGELGDETFWTGVQRYIQRHAGGVVETDDFRRVLEEVSGRSLARFFDQWFRSPGYPQLKVSFNWDAKRFEGSFDIEQSQVDEKAGVPCFDLQLELGWVIDGELHTRRVRLREARQHVVVPMASDPEQVRVDPNGRLLHKLEFNPGDDKLLRQLTGAADIGGRIHAGRVLCESGRMRGVRAVAEAYAAEPFWGVRAQWARALADGATPAAIEALANIIEKEQDPRALEPLMRAASGVRDERLRRAIEARLDAQGGLPYRATQAAFEALGRFRLEAPYERLAKAAQTEGYGGIAQAGALRGLAATRRDEALGALLDRAPIRATETRARPAVSEALGELGRVLERRPRERVRECLEDLLRDSESKVAWMAMLALRGLGAAESIPALRAYERTLPAQDRVTVDRAVKEIRDRAASKAGGVPDEVEKLRTELRKLQERVDKLSARVEDAPEG